jgi:hypothetical protein
MGVDGVRPEVSAGFHRLPHRFNCHGRCLQRSPRVWRNPQTLHLLLYLMRPRVHVMIVAGPLRA